MATKRILRYVFLLMGLTGILMTGALQYTHDTTHQPCKEHHHQQGHAVDDCALCWFVAHQVTPDFSLGNDLLPQAFISSKARTFAKTTHIGYDTIVCLSKGNKDPPFVV